MNTDNRALFKQEGDKQIKYPIEDQKRECRALKKAFKNIIPHTYKATRMLINAVLDIKFNLIHLKQLKAQYSSFKADIDHKTDMDIYIFTSSMIKSLANTASIIIKARKVALAVDANSIKDTKTMDAENKGDYDYAYYDLLPPTGDAKEDESYNKWYQKRRITASNSASTPSIQPALSKTEHVSIHDTMVFIEESDSSPECTLDDITEISNDLAFTPLGAWATDKVVMLRDYGDEKDQMEDTEDLSDTRCTVYYSETSSNSDSTVDPNSKSSANSILATVDEDEVRNVLDYGARFDSKTCYSQSSDSNAAHDYNDDSTSSYVKYHGSFRPEQEEEKTISTSLRVEFSERLILRPSTTERIAAEVAALKNYYQEITSNYAQPSTPPSPPPFTLDALPEQDEGDDTPSLVDNYHNRTSLQ